MQPIRVVLTVFGVLACLPVPAPAATTFDPVRLVSAAHPAATRSATPQGDSLNLQLSADGAWVLYLSNARDVATNLSGELILNLYLFERSSGKTTLISADASGTGGGDWHSVVGQLTPDGRYVAFESIAENLVSGVDTNYSSDVFLRDVVAGTTRLISVNQHGTGPGLGGSVEPEITPDGRFIAFASTAEDLVEGDTNGLADVFVYDLLTESMDWVSAGSTSPMFAPGIYFGSAGPRLSADGRWVAFTSTAGNMVVGVSNPEGEVYLRDRSQGTMICPSAMVEDVAWLPDGVNVMRRQAFSPSLSEGGEVLAWVLEVTLGSPSANQRLRSLWRFETASSQPQLITTNLNVAPFIEQALYIMTPDGRWFAYQTFVNEIRNDLELWDAQTGTAVLASPGLDGVTGADGLCDAPELSANGRFLVFSSNAGNLVTNVTDGQFNVFLRDLELEETMCVTSDPSGTALGGTDFAFPRISEAGDWIVFDSNQSGFVAHDRNSAYDVFLFERQSDDFTLVSRAEPAAQSVTGSGQSSLGRSPFSADGGRLVFRSDAHDLIAGQVNSLAQIYLHDVVGGTNLVVSVEETGNNVANAGCFDQAPSGDGRIIVYSSAADNLAPGDTNGRIDVFVHDLESGLTQLISRNPATGKSANHDSIFPVTSHDGDRVVFLSAANDLVQPAATSVTSLQAYLHDRSSQSTLGLTHPPSTTVVREPPRLASDGRFIAYANLRLPARDAWLYDADLHLGVELFPGSPVASLTEDGFSGDGLRLVTWGSDSFNPSFLLRRDLGSGTDARFYLATGASGASVDGVLDHVGRFMAFTTTMGLVEIDTNQLADVYLFDFDSATLTLVSLNHEGTAAGQATSRSPSMSGDGRLVAFASEAGDLVWGDTNGASDVFVYDRFTGTLAMASVSAESAPGNSRSGNPHLSPIGYRLAYTSAASNFVSPDHGGLYDVFLTTVSPFQAVDDGDGMADHWELEHFGDLEVPPNDDPDLDGVDNLDEFIAGTDPQDRSSHPRLNFVWDGAGGSLRWTPVPGRVYTIESRPYGVTGAWSRGAGIIRVGGNSAVYKPAPAETAPCYFRLRVVNESGP